MFNTHQKATSLKATICRKNSLLIKVTSTPLQALTATEECSMWTDQFRGSWTNFHLWRPQFFLFCTKALCTTITQNSISWSWGNTMITQKSTAWMTNRFDMISSVRTTMYSFWETIQDSELGMKLWMMMVISWNSLESYQLYFAASLKALLWKSLKIMKSFLWKTLKPQKNTCFWVKLWMLTLRNFLLSW